MPDNLISVDEAVARSRSHWLMESGIHAACYGLALAFNVWAPIAQLKSLHTEFGFTLSREQYRPKAFAQILVRGDYGKLLETTRRERKAGIR
jgi:hypothetical protein